MGEYLLRLGFPNEGEVLDIAVPRAYLDAGDILRHIVLRDGLVVGIDDDFAGQGNESRGGVPIRRSVAANKYPA